MKRSIIFFTVLFIVITDVSGQYFQQKVKHKIEASIDTTTHVITASSVISYTHQGPKSLDTIYLHLWANAFQDKLSAYSRQTLRRGNRDFYFAKDQQLGGYEDVSVIMGGASVLLKRWRDNTDVVYFTLPKGIASGETVDMYIHYKLKLPMHFSRMGYKRYEDYLMYWYPAPAVYDDKGWHPMPYLDYGEGYNEIADYDITFDLPYRDIIGSSPYEVIDGKTHFVANNIVDFAIIGSHKKEVHHYAVPTSKRSMLSLSVMSSYKERADSIYAYTTKAMTYLEDIIGPYPYESLSILDKGSKSTSGMEYSALFTVSGDHKNGDDLEYYVVHELIHMWFYGALTFDQRAYPWMDEGLTTYYQQRYFEEKKGYDHYDKKSSILLQNQGDHFLKTIAKGQACRHFHQPITTPVANLSPVNYGLNAYEVPARIFWFMADYVGKDAFDTGIQAFFENYKFTHPSPRDLQLSLEEASRKSLEDVLVPLILEDWAHDYTIEGLEGGKLALSHLSGSTPPYKIRLEGDSEHHKDIWIEGHSGKKIIDVGSQWTRATIDPEQLSLDVNPNNNYHNIHRPIRFVPGAKLDAGKVREIYFLPTVAFNTSDGGQVGFGVYNSTFPTKTLKWAISPAYAFGSKRLVGEGWISKEFYLSGNRFRKWQLKLNAKSYHFFKLEDKDDALRYVRLSPTVSLHKHHEPIAHKYSKYYFRPIYISRERFVFDSTTVSKTVDPSIILRLGYEYYNFWELGPSELTSYIEFQPYTNLVGEQHHYLKLVAAYSKSFYYAPTRKVDFRLWGTYFLLNSQRLSTNYSGDFARGAAALIHQGYNDYAFDDYFFNRYNQGAGWSNQISNLGGGLKNAIGSEYSIGQSNDLAIAINFKSDLPVKMPKILPLKVFMDVGYYTTAALPSKKLVGQTIFNGGLMLEYGQGLFSIYLPLVNSANVNEIYDLEGVGTLGKISFRIDLNRFNPWDIAEDYSF